MESPASIAAQRSEFYWFLSGFFLHGPSGEFLDNLKQIQTSGQDDGGESLQQVVPTWADAGLDAQTLNIEFTRLFQGLREGYGPPPPYESVHRQNRLVGCITVSVMNAYREAGFGIIDGHVGPQDHIEVELKFMALLCYREMQARDVCDEQEAASWLERQLHFLDEHALKWIPAYCDSVRRQTTQDYFRNAVDITKTFLLDDRKQIAELRMAATADNLDLMEEKQ